jgi:hypothetical protein
MPTVRAEAGGIAVTAPHRHRPEGAAYAAAGEIYVPLFYAARRLREALDVDSHQLTVVLPAGHPIPEGSRMFGMAVTHGSVTEPLIAVRVGR